MSTESYASLTSAGCHNFVVPSLFTNNSIQLHNDGLTVLDLYTCRNVKVVRELTNKFVKKNRIRKIKEEKKRRRKNMQEEQKKKEDKKDDTGDINERVKKRVRREKIG
jgi:hypothetical protein